MWYPGRVVLVGFCCCRWGEGVEWRCAGFCAPRIYGRNQVDQNSVYGDSKLIIPIHTILIYLISPTDTGCTKTCTPPLKPLSPSTTAEPKKNNPAQCTKTIFRLFTFTKRSQLKFLSSKYCKFNAVPIKHRNEPLNYVIIN